MLKLDKRPCLVVGGGAVALRKVLWLLELGAAVEVLSLEFDQAFSALGEEHGDCLRCCQGAYASTDLSPYLLVIAATSDSQVNLQVFEDASLARIPVNVVDQPDLCSFYVPATIRRGPVKITVSTDGSVPALSARLRSDLEAQFPLWYQDYVPALAEVRTWVKAEVSDINMRGRIMKHLASPDVSSQLAEMSSEEMVEHMRKLAQEMCEQLSGD